MVEKTYIRKDLIDYVSGTVEDALVYENDDSRWDRFPNTRKDALVKVLPETADVHAVSAGSYDGEHVLCVELGGYIWLRHGYYGSCGGCDAYQGDALAETERILRGAYCFETKADALAYLETTDDFGYRVEELRERAKNLVRDL